MVAASTGDANGVGALAGEQSDAMNSQSPGPDMAAALRTPENVVSADATIAGNSGDDAAHGRWSLCLIGQAWEGCIDSVEWQHQATSQSRCQGGMEWQAGRVFRQGDRQQGGGLQDCVEQLAEQQLMLFTTGCLIDSIDQDDGSHSLGFRWFLAMSGLSTCRESTEQQQLPQWIERTVITAAGQFLGQLSAVTTSQLPSCTIRLYLAGRFRGLDPLGDLQQPVGPPSGCATGGNK